MLCQVDFRGFKPPQDSALRINMKRTHTAQCHMLTSTNSYIIGTRLCLYSPDELVVHVTESSK